MLRLIWVFAERTGRFVRLSCSGSHVYAYVTLCLFRLTCLCICHIVSIPAHMSMHMSHCFYSGSHVYAYVTLCLFRLTCLCICHIVSIPAHMSMHMSHCVYSGSPVYAYVSIFRDNNGCIKPRKQRTSTLHESQSYYLSRLATKPTKWHVLPAKSQTSLGLHPVRSESSLSARRSIGSLAVYWVHGEDTVQTRDMPSLIWVFAGRTDHLFCHDVAQFWCVCCLFDVYECWTVFWRFSFFMISLKFTLNVSWLLDWLRRFNASVLEPYNCRYHIIADNIVFQFSSSNVFITKF